MPMRWRAAMLVSAAIAISYLDRQALPVAVKAIEADIPLTNTQFGEPLDTGFTYDAVFNIVGSLHVIALVVILVAIPRIGAIDGP